MNCWYLSLLLLSLSLNAMEIKQETDTHVVAINPDSLEELLRQTFEEYSTMQDPECLKTLEERMYVLGTLLEQAIAAHQSY